MTLHPPTHKLILHVEVPGLNVDDIPERLAIWEADPADPKAVAEMLTDEDFRAEVGLTVVSWPGEKCMNDDFGVHALNARIVGAQVVEVDR